MIAALAAVWIVQNTATNNLRAAQLTACANVNVLVAQQNNNTDIIRYFMQQIVAATNAKKDTASHQRAIIYKSFEDSLKDITPVNCSRVVR